MTSMDDAPAPVDSMSPWTIKSVSTATRDAVTKAARKEGLTVGQWLEKRVAEWLEDGEPVHLAQPGTALSLTLAGPRPGMEDLKSLVGMARDLAQGEDDTLLRLARTVVRARLKEAR
jgi:hypothetical protein